MSGQFRWRTAVRRRLPDFLLRAGWARKPDSDCGDHEFYNDDDLVDRCYHCTVGERPHQSINSGAEITDRARRIWLMPEYAAPPLWTEHGPVTPESLGLSAGLVQKINDWLHEWDRGGEDDSTDEEFGARGEALAAEIQSELGPDVRVEYDG